MWRSLRVRLLLATFLVVVVTAGVTAYAASRGTMGEFQRYVQDRGVLRDRRILGSLNRSYLTGQNWSSVQLEIERIAQLLGQRVVVADTGGRVVADSERSLVGRSVAANWPPPSAPIIVEGIIVGSLYLDPVPAEATAAEQAFLAAVNRSVLSGALIAGLAAIAITLFLSMRILRPVERLTAAAQRLQMGDLGARVQVEAEDEIGKLAHAFNAMAGGLAQQEELRRNMVSDVAHELRTPLTNLRGYLQAARDGLVPTDRDLVDNLYEESMLLSRLVADLQELAQAEAGQLTLVPQTVAVDTIVDQAIGMLRPQADEKGIALETDLPSDLPAVRADPERFGQVLRNLLNNSISHTPSGGRILVDARSTPAAPAGDGEQSAAVTVRVCDTGSGIAPEHLPYVFDRFYRADLSRARLTGGAGLGLAIVRQLVTAMGGKVWVESTEGCGSTFSFTLPTES